MSFCIKKSRKKHILSQTYNATRLIFVRPIGVGQFIRVLMKKLWCIVSKLSAERFAELNSDWQILILGVPGR